MSPSCRRMLARVFGAISRLWWGMTVMPPVLGLCQISWLPPLTKSGGGLARKPRTEPRISSCLAHELTAQSAESPHEFSVAHQAATSTRSLRSCWTGSRSAGSGLPNCL